MRVAVVTERWDPAGGGAERSTEQIVRRLIQRGHEVTVLAGRAESEGVPKASYAAEQRVEVEKPSGGTRGAAGLRRFGWWVQRRLDELAPDVSLSVTMAAAADVVQPRSGTIVETQRQNVASRGARGSGWTKRLSQAVSPKQRALRAAERRTLQSARVQRVVAISDYVARQLAEHHGVAADRVVRIDNAAEGPTTDVATRERWRAVQRRAWGAGEGEAVFLFAALNWRLKGFEELMAAAARLPDASSPSAPQRRLPGGAWQLWLVGPYRYGHVQAVAEAGLSERVRWLGVTQRMDRLYAASDVLVHPTWYDPSSKVVLEAVLAGRPAVTTRFNGAGEVLEASGGGRGVDRPDDAAGLAAAMAAMLDPATRASHVAAAERAGLRERLTMDRHVDRLEAVLREVAGRGGGVRRWSEPYQTLLRLRRISVGFSRHSAMSRAGPRPRGVLSQSSSRVVPSGLRCSRCSG
jgi:UDP-glucose:(heptosyl)LPS alpha-1,3-glucosyltransferase